MATPYKRTVQSLVNDSAVLALIAWATGAVTLAIWLAWFLFSKVNVSEVSRAAHIEVQQSPSPVSAAISGKIDSMALALGQSVHAGDILVRLNTSSEELRLREEEFRRQAIAPRILSLRAEIEALGRVRSADQSTSVATVASARFRTAEIDAALDFAKDNERRLKEESATGSVAHIDAARASAEALKLAANKGALTAEERRLESDLQARTQQNLVQVETLKRAIVTLEGEQSTIDATIERLKNDIEKHLVRSPADGKIGEVTLLRPGAFVPEGQKLATVVPVGDMIIVAEFPPAAALGRIQVGQIARLRLDGFPWSQFGSIEARVFRVATEIRDQVVRVELAPLPGTAPKIIMQHGLPGVVSVNLEKASPAELILRAVGQLTVASNQVSGASIAPKAP